MPKQIPLTRGKFALVDDDMYEYLNQWKWQYEGTGYASRKLRIEGNKYKIIKMHREIMNVNYSKIEVDHIDRDKLNNQKDNLRLVSRKQNSANKVAYSNNTTGYKCVSYDKRYNKYRAYIKVDGKQKGLGYYTTKEEAAKAYNDAASFYFGEFACLNNLRELVE